MKDHVCEGRLMSSPTIAIIGLGLMGASFAAALKASSISCTLIGYDTDPAALKQCLKREWIDEKAASPAEAAAKADILLLATPVETLDKIILSIAPALREGVVITDLCSVKQEAINRLSAHLPEHAHLVPAHPIAGSAKTGAEAADADLFRGKLLILTPEKDKTANHAIAAVARLWEAVGCRTERMSAGNHDIIYGYVSHLPQMLAFAACKTLGDEPMPDTIPESFRRFIRLGGSDARLWHGIFIANREYVRHALSHVLATLDHMQQEFDEGMKLGKESKDNPQVAVRFFPMLAAASMVSVIAQFEVQNKVHLAPYGGSGMKDFTAPTADNPNEDLAAISESYGHVARLLARFREILQGLDMALADITPTSENLLADLLESCRNAHSVLIKKLA